jgi:hypothetical protein
MARKLKTFQTSLGVYYLAIAAPSMKAALEDWSAKSNLFHQVPRRLRGRRDDDVEARRRPNATGEQLRSGSTQIPLCAIFLV